MYRCQTNRDLRPSSLGSYFRSMEAGLRIQGEFSCDIKRLSDMYSCASPLNFEISSGAIRALGIIEKRCFIA